MPLTRPMTKMETQAGLHPAAPMAQRQASLASLREVKDPEGEIIAAVVPILNDPDPTLQEMAKRVLLGWGSRSITYLLNTLRTLGAVEIEQKRVIIQLLAQFGPLAVRAEPYLRPLLLEPSLEEDAQLALSAVRQDWSNLLGLCGLGLKAVLQIAIIVGIPLLLINFNQPPARRMGWEVIVCIILIGGGVWMIIRQWFSSNIGARPEDLMADPEKRNEGIMIACFALGLLCGGAVLAFFLADFGPIKKLLGMN